ncbi:MAG: selenocysteine-specific translation elongation factor [Acidimicrobiales bacterium]|nr:selenocysteine-specific translation elongation factor [Acidimicrobiales bacterium]
MRVVATAGHVDHGKSTLVLALTGTDPDRWAEEKRRGLTIDLGFAWAELPSGRVVAFVDVPGHVRFLGNMLAGVGAVDACVFVVAATEGWKPQSEEHLRILEVLGVRRGLVALTKVDLVDADGVRRARCDVAERLAGTFLAGAEVVEVAAPAGVGVGELRAAIDRLVAATPAAADRGRPRLWVDRAFAARGAGTVVTGTLTGGSLAVDDGLVLVPGERRVRVRSLQSLQQPVDRVAPGSRVAVNLAGIAHAAVSRGDALVRPGQWRPTAVVDAELAVLASLDHDVSGRGAYLLHVGSAEQAVRLRVLGGAAILPGERGPVRLRLAARLPLLPGDRFVLREAGRDETVGGGEVLDVDPVLPASRARPDRSVDRVIAERGWLEPDELEALTGERRPPTVGRWVVAPAALAAARHETLDAVDGAGPLGLDVATLTGRQRAVLATLDGITVEAGRVRLGAVDDPLAGHPFVAALASSPFAPPGADGVDPAERRELVRRGLVVERDGHWFAASAVDAAARLVARLLGERPDGVTVSEVRDALGSSRRHVVPLLAELDARGVTRRRGDVRVAGPRLPPPDPG